MWIIELSDLHVSSHVALDVDAIRYAESKLYELALEERAWENMIHIESHDFPFILYT